MERVLYAVDELTGLLGAIVLMYPSKRAKDLNLKSVRKKFKDRKFAAGCSREVISRGAGLLGWTLDELFEKTIAALQSLEPEGCYLPPPKVSTSDLKRLTPADPKGAYPPPPRPPERPPPSRT